MDKVQIEHRLVDRIGIREFGLPTLRMPGQIWRSEIHQTISCMVSSADKGFVNIETRDLIVVPVGELSIMPDHWRDALWEYVQAWPGSGAGLGPFLRITEADRNQLIRKMAEGLKDDIGCRSIAHDMGQLAAVEYELVEPPRPKKWRSIAVWPDTIKVGNEVGKNESDDTHDSREAAEAVCNLLRQHGFGGDGQIFPLSTRVEPVTE